MINNKLIIGNELLFDENNFNVCPSCGNVHLNEVVSNLNATYQYCNICGYATDSAFKNKCIDFILSELKNHLENYNIQFLSSLKVEIIKNKNNLSLFINNIPICNIDFVYNFTNTEVYFIESNIAYLIDDYLGLENTKSDIIVCA